MTGNVFAVPINNWWDQDSQEKYWMEIRAEPEGLGEYLVAPKHGAGGQFEWSYSLVSYAQPGDIVFHWHREPQREPAIIGSSIVVGPLESLDAWSWKARGTAGRSRTAPTVGPAWRVAVRDFTRLSRPITRSAINERRLEILALFDDVQSSVGGESIYPPFQNYGNRELRAQQGYFTKFPAALVGLLWPVRRPLDPQSSAESTFVPSSRSQGRQVDAAVRSAVERHAVRRAIAHYRELGARRIEELGKPYDLRVLVDGAERHVEVKGSAGFDLDSVQLTQGEVDHARQYQPTDLFVVEAIQVGRRPDGSIETSGGVARVWKDWQPKDRHLRPTQLRYTLPT